jgi:NAD(P)-dependent dehydrogenase (short-subunit alcohol dehydrogenase family)
MTEKKIVLVTGSSDGIGKLTAIELAKKGMNVLVHGRNADKTNQVAGEIREATGNPEVEAFVSDLSSMQGVRRLARLVSERHDRLSILINNAGVGFADPRFNDEGMELRFAVNYLAPFLLTRLLLPLLKKAAPSRIINVSSAGQQALDLNDLTGQQVTDPVNAYRRSKLALIMFTIDLAEELNGSGVTVNCLHPGTYLNTKLVRRAGI